MATIQANPRNDLTGVDDSSQDDQLEVIVSSPDTMSNKTGASNDILIEDCDEAELNNRVPGGLNNISASTITHLQNCTPKEESANSETHDIDKGEATDVIGEEIVSSEFLDEREQLDQDGSTITVNSNLFTLTRSKKVVDIPGNIIPEDPVDSYKDDAVRSVASSVSEIPSLTQILSCQQAEEGSEVSDEDDDDSLKSYVSGLSAKRNVSDTLTESKAEDNYLPDDDAPNDETLSGVTCIPREISLDESGTCNQDDTYKNIVSTSIELKVVDMANNIRDENKEKYEQDTTSRLLRSGSEICRGVKTETPVTDCQQVDQEIAIKEDDSKLTATCANTEMLGEKPEQVVENSFSSKIRKNIFPNFNELDVATKGDDSYAPSSETSPDPRYKTFSSGQKYGGVSSIINKYNTLLDSAVPTSDKDKFKPKSVKALSKDPASCARCVNEKLEVACDVSTNEDTDRDDVKISSAKTKGAQESNQNGDTPFLESRTDNSVDCRHTKISTNTCEDEENKTSTIEDENNTRTRCDTNRNCGDISLAASGNEAIADKDLTREDTAVSNTESFQLVVEDVEENELPDKLCTTAAVENVWERNIESPSESNSIWFGSTVDSSEEPFAIDTNESIDADDEFSSQEEYKGLTPTSPMSTDDGEILYRMGMMTCRDEIRRHTVGTEESYASDNGKPEERHVGGRYRDDENVCTVPHLTSGSQVMNTCQINLNDNLKRNDIGVFFETSSQGASHADEQTVERHIPADSSLEQLDVDDKEVIYLDAESGDLNEQSETSWEQLVSCCNSGNQSCSEIQECVQLFSNEDMKSIESGSVYDDVASGSHFEYSSIKNISDGPNLKYVSSYCSENDSCSNFYSEEGDHKQTDNHDGYLSALDVGEDPDIFRSTEHLEHFDSARISNVSGKDGNQNDVKISVSEMHCEYTTDSPNTPEEDKGNVCMPEENATSYDTTDVVDSMETKEPHRTEEESENVIENFDTNESGKQVDLVNREDITSYTTVNSIGSLCQESDIETNNVVPSIEDTAETTIPENKDFTHEESDYSPNEGSCTDCKEVSTCLIEMVDQTDTLEDNIGNEDNVLDESIVADETNSEEMADITATERTIHNGMSDCVELNVSLNSDMVYNSDASLDEEFHFSEDTSVENLNGSSSMEEDLEDVSSEQLSTQEVTQDDTTIEDGSEAPASDGEDEETKDACCEEFQVLWKRMKKLRKTMESLNDQVSREKCYLEEETEMYKNLPSYEVSLFEEKLAEVQRERWLEQQPGNITQEEYWRRLKEADQMCGEEIQQMNFAEEKLRHLTRITDVWMRTNVALPYYDPPALDLVVEVPEVESPEVTQKKVDQLATEVVDMIGPSDAYMTSWLINEADKMKVNSNHQLAGNRTSNLQNNNDLSVDEMLLPPHLLEKLEVLRDVVKANSLTGEMTQNMDRSHDQNVWHSNLPECHDLPLNQSLELGNQPFVPRKIDSTGNSEYSETSDGT